MDDKNGALDERAQLVKRVWLLNVSVSVTGRTTSKRKLADRFVGAARERDYEVDERIENENQFKAAKSLESRIRAIADRFGTYLDGYGYLASEANKVAFLAEFERTVETDVAAHNAEPGQTALIRPKHVALPIGVVFGAEDVTGVLNHIAAELSGARTMLAEGKLEAVTNWLKRGQRLTGLLPSLNASVVVQAIDALREAKNTAARFCRDSMGAEAYRANDAVPTDVLARAQERCPEWQTMNDAVDAALGWLAPSEGGT